MRGIAGIINLDQRPVERAAIDRLLHATAIGPADLKDVWCEGAAGLARCIGFSVPEDRFESELGPDAGSSFVLVTDGLLTNRDELAQAFGWSSDEAAGKADSAFVRAAYAKWGRDCPSRLDGQFALVAWHPKERRVFAAVDALGFRPIYYWQSGGMFAFATTLRGLFSVPQVSHELNARVFAEGFLGLDQVTDETLYRDVRRVLRGHSLAIEGSEVKISRYWWPSATPTLRLKSDAEYIEAFRAEFTRAVKSSLRTNGAVGLMLSGGLDSASIGALADGLLGRQGWRLQAFHFLPPGPPRHHATLRELDESSYVRDLESAFPHTDFHFYASTPQPLLTEEELAQHHDDERIPSHTLLTRRDPALRAFFAQQQIGTMLNGFGGNTLVSLEARGGGYLSYLAATGRWIALAREIQGHHRVYGTGRKFLLRETFEQSGWIRSAPTHESVRLRLLNPDHPAGRIGAERLAEARTPPTLRQAGDLRGKWLRFLLEDAAQHTGVSGSAISRYELFPRQLAPMFDRRLNEFCLRLPPRQQFRDGEDRRMLREAMRGVLPERNRLRTTRGFPAPDFQSAFSLHRETLLTAMERLIAVPVNATWFNPAFVQELITRLRRPSTGPREEYAAASFFGWAGFLDWWTRRG